MLAFFSLQSELLAVGNKRKIDCVPAFLKVGVATHRWVAEIWLVGRGVNIIKFLKSFNFFTHCIQSLVACCYQFFSLGNTKVLYGRSGESGSNAA